MGRLTVFSMRNRALVALTTVFGILAGLWSAATLPRELFPSLQFPVIVAVTALPGSGSSVIEAQVTRPVEVAALGLNNVVEVSSTSREGLSSVLVELDYGTDLTQAQTDLQRAVLALPALPDGARPQIFAGSLDDFPIIQLAASGGADAQDLVDRLQRVVIPQIEDLDGVRAVTLSGVADRVVTVDLDEARAAALGVTPQTVAQTLQLNGVVLPGGRVLDGTTELPVQVGARLASADELARLPVFTPQALAARAGQPNTGQSNTGQPNTGQPGVPVLGDVATVTYAPRAAAAYTRTNGEPSVGLAITKTPDGNAVEVSHALAALTPEIRSALGGGQLVTIYDGAPFVEESIKDLTTEGLLGLGFAVLVVLVFLLSVRLTLVTALSIPLSLLLAMAGLSAAGYSLNILTLGALTIAIGRVVDDSIVVIENIKRHIARGDDRRHAVVTATQEVARAITSATVATVAVFLPLGFVGGQVGELFRPFAITVSLAMLASLLVALTIIPVLGYWFLGSSSEQPRAVDQHRADAPDRLQRAYLPVLRRALAHPWLTVGLAILLLVGTGYAATHLTTDFIGSSRANQLQATLTLPTGTRLADTDAQARRVEAWLGGQGDVTAYQVTAGSPGGIEAVFLGSGANTARFAITLRAGTDGQAFGERLKAAVTGLPPGASLVVAQGQQMGPTALEVVVQGQDAGALRTTADQVTQVLHDAGAADVVNDLAETVPSLRITVDRAAAARVGLTELQLAQTVQAATSGTTVGRVELDGRQVSVVVRAGAAADLATLRRLPVAAVPGAPAVVLDDVADLDQVQEAVSVTRIDGLRAATISGRPPGGDLGAVSRDLQTRLDALTVPDGVQVRIAGVSADQAKAFAALGLALLAAIAIVYLVMVATFNSLVQPLILMVSVPFAATGSIGLLLLTRTALDVSSMIGLLMLVGIVVTNAIVLIDLVNQYRARGDDRTTAVVEGARHRLRPIVMTALATILALTPMGLALTGGGAFISQPLAIVVIGGLLSSTALTLVLVPVLYELVERGVEGLRARRARRRGRPGRPAVSVVG